MHVGDPLKPRSIKDRIGDADRGFWILGVTSSRVWCGCISKEDENKRGLRQPRDTRHEQFEDLGKIEREVCVGGVRAQISDRGSDDRSRSSISRFKSHTTLRLAQQRLIDE